MVYGTYNELVTGAYKPTYNWGASHCKYFSRLEYTVPIGSMVLLYMVTWIPSTYPKCIQMLAYIPYMDPMGYTQYTVLFFGKHDWYVRSSSTKNVARSAIDSYPKSSKKKQFMVFCWTLMMFSLGQMNLNRSIIPLNIPDTLEQNYHQTLIFNIDWFWCNW